MDSWDYALNFSGEMLATGLVIIVAATNIGAFGVFKNEHDLTDGSLAGRLLARHSSYNVALYNKSNSIKTTIIKQQGIISSAYADYGALSSDSNNDSGIPANSDGSVNEFADNGLTKPNPDTTRALMEKQITIYETVPGDTISSVAKKYGVSRNSIIWSNNLGNSLKPGWYLMIPPITGIVYQADSNDTLPDIAKYFRGDLERIISYNNLASAEDIEGGQWIICPDCTVPPPPPPPTPKPGKTSPPATKGSRIQVRISGAHSFPAGYCTYFASQQFGGVPWGGNAKSWLGNAPAFGYATGKTPKVGSIAVTTDSARYGHVAIVTGVQSDGDITVKEMNYEGFGVISSRTIPRNSGTVRGFIYHK